jgi:hypothetical protein
MAEPEMRLPPLRLAVMEKNWIPACAGITKDVEMTKAAGMKIDGGRTFNDCRDRFVCDRVSELNCQVIKMEVSLEEKTKHWQK